MSITAEPDFPRKSRAHLITLSGNKVLIHRRNAALYLLQWRAARLRIKCSKREDGTKAYFCRYTNETVTVNPVCDHCGNPIVSDAFGAIARHVFCHAAPKPPSK